jgi:hypothetical protein
MVFGWKTSFSVRGEHHQIWDETILKKSRTGSSFSASCFSQPLLTALTLSLSLCRQSLHQSSSTPGAGACVKARPCWEQELSSKLVRALSQEHTVVGLEQCLSGDVLVCWWDVVGTMTGMAWMVTPGSHR